MNIDTIVEKINSEARQAASQTLENARARAVEIEQRTAQENEKALAAAARDAEQESVLLRERRLRMAALEDKKDLLVMKRQLIDASFEKALQKMHDMSTDQARKLSLGLIQQNAQGDEQLAFGAGDEAVYDEAFLAQANATLAATGKPGRLSYASDRLDQRGGFVLRRGGMQMEMTWGTLLAARRPEWEADVAALLFS